MAQKGIDILLEAFEMIMRGEVSGSGKVKDKIRLILVGSGDRHQENEARRLESLFPENMKAIIAYLGREATREYYGARFCPFVQNLLAWFSWKPCV